MRLEAVEHHYVQVNGIRMHYAQSGAGERLIVLLHGFPECWYSWRHQFEALSRYGTVVAPDMRGYNETEKPAWGYELNTLVADIAGLITALGRERAVVVGHDWGGAIAWSLAIARPECIERLAVLNAPHPGRFGPGAGMSTRQLLRSAYIAFFQLPWLPELLLRWDDYIFVERQIRSQIRNRANVSDDDLRIFRQAIARPGALHAALQYYRRGLLHTGGIFHGTGLRVMAPTLLIWGEDDVYLGRELTGGTERFVPNFRLKTIPNCSHWVQQDAPELVNRWLAEFLDEERA